MGRGANGKIIFPKCCFCIDLKTGVIVLGILSSIAIGIAMIAYIILLAGFAVGSGMDFSSYGISNPQLNAQINAGINAGLVTSIVGTIVFAIYFVSSILLCVGASKEKPKLLIPWMVLSLVSIIWCIISIILVFTMPKSNQTYAWGDFGSLVVSIFITIYFEMVVLSLYNKFNDYVPTPQI